MTNEHDAVNTNISNAVASITSSIDTRSVLKSVQRGYVKEIKMKAYEKSTVEIPISDINPDKSIILINFHYHSDNNYKMLDLLITKNKILIKYDNSNVSVDERIGNFDYQIIEFY